MVFKKIQRKTLVKYSLITIVSVAGFAFYTSDHEAPVLTGFSFSENDTGDYEFTGRLTDERGVSYAEFECLSGEKLKQVIVLPMSGINRNKASFGVLSDTPQWVGNWKGTSYDLTFTGLIRTQEVDMTCDWRVRLKDNLGNETRYWLEN